MEPDKAIKTVGDAGSIHPVGSTVERDSSTTTKVAPLVTAINRSGSKKQALGEQLSKASDLVTNNTIKQGNIAELSVTNNKSDIAPKTAIKDRLFNKSRVEEELFVEMSSKPVGELYSIPNFVPKEHRAKMRVASLDLKSATKFAEPKAIFTPYPKYPRRAWSKMVNQKVHVDFEIGTDGAVVNVSVAEGTVRSFAREIKRKLKLWRYEPAILAGRKVTHSTSVLFEFEAPQKKRIIPIQTGSRIKRF